MQKFKAAHLDGKNEFLVNQAYPANSSQCRYWHPFPPTGVILWQSCNIIVTDQRPLKSFSALKGACNPVSLIKGIVLNRHCPF